MDGSQTVGSTNGAGVTDCDAVSPAPLPCPLNDLPEKLHHYIHALEGRIVQLESEQKRFTNALLGAGKFIFDNPASKMMLAAFPKEAQLKLKEFFSGSR